MEKYRRVGQATDGNIIGSMRIACWKLKATNTHSEYVEVGDQADAPVTLNPVKKPFEK